MHNLGHTRSVHAREYYLLTPDTFVRTVLPGMKDAVAVVHISPVAGAGFTQYSAEMESGGVLGGTSAQRFIFVLEGVVELNAEGKDYKLGVDGYAYLPVGVEHTVTATKKTRLAVIEKTYDPLAGVVPAKVLVGSEGSVKSVALMGDKDLQVKSLLPEDAAFDFAVNTMSYEPGASLSMTEIHIMEHGLLMLEGGGIYKLGSDWHPVTVGDFIWMAPYCPQWFGAIGKKAAKYLIYKDWNRHPLA